MEFKIFLANVKTDSWIFKTFGFSTNFILIRYLFSSVVDMIDVSYTIEYTVMSTYACVNFKNFYDT